jgi:hypothetical protein
MFFEFGFCSDSHFFSWAVVMGVGGSLSNSSLRPFFWVRVARTAQRFGVALELTAEEKKKVEQEKKKARAAKFGLEVEPAPAAAAAGGKGNNNKRKAAAIAVRVCTCIHTHAYAQNMWWCFFVSAHSAQGEVWGSDVWLSPRWSDGCCLLGFFLFFVFCFFWGGAHVAYKPHLIASSLFVFLLSLFFRRR